MTDFLDQPNPKPIHPWTLITARILPGFDKATFCEEHKIDPGSFDTDAALTDEKVIAALSKASGMTVQFFQNLNDRYAAEAAKRSGPGLDPGTYASN